MSPLEMIAEWRRGCSCSGKGHPENCQKCTRGLIDSLEMALKNTQEIPKRYQGGGSLDVIGRDGCKLTIRRLNE